MPYNEQKKTADPSNAAVTRLAWPSEGPIGEIWSRRILVLVDVIHSKLFHSVISPVIFPISRSLSK